MSKEGPNINTYTGKKLYFESPSRGDIDIKDIAHALSMLCRFTGHTSQFYSVASHSLLVAEHCEGGPVCRMVGLLHDAAEAYLGDVSSPLKSLLPTYRDLHEDLLGVIFAKFGLFYDPGSIAMTTAMQADKIALVYEVEAFFVGVNEDVHDGLRNRGFNSSLLGVWDPWDPHRHAAHLSVATPRSTERAFLTKFRMLQQDIVVDSGRQDGRENQCPSIA